MPDHTPTHAPSAVGPDPDAAVGLAPAAAHPSRRRLAVILGAVLAILAAVNVADKYGPHHTGLVAGPTVALALVLLARRAGLSWHDLGLSRRTLLPGLKYAIGAVAVVAVVYTIGAAIPATRVAFHDVRYHLHPGAALLTAFVIVPLGTVLLEEIAFRGVLLGLIHRHRGATWASITSSVLFGLWHILPSLRLAEVNQAVGGTLGSGLPGTILAILGAVAFTAIAGLLLCELRRRSGSLLAAAALHWATNGLGLLIAAALATTTLT
ncbi:abortive infection protein [Actinoplanes sp. SE50]|uniref:CPBP family intramembrane glutamic endopeptidase n=1 Tax=unclassified Actinoplanes TaxID=2626549 RepID=UPI00023ECAE4|nr:MULTISPECIES: CPBP family intramembrane glutamic endopeptidase [unclassified Actinoplanes]AEV83724.1 abortive infection protein [Actinoplanes sp. SE50/110]ATO82132.1 abortive infection protein [Actinoplanes sp. SE50]SLL99539.1 abortive infection protein [Actinoplanes sp. SE50/110]